MRNALTMIFIVLLFILLWQIGYVREFSPPCSGRFCQKVEAVEVAEEKEKPLDIRILCQAIAVAETQGCTTGSALSHKNCHGITKRSGGYVTYANTDESFLACEDLWRRKYVRFPDLELAARWSSPGAAETWLGNVTKAYAARLR